MTGLVLRVAALLCLAVPTAANAQPTTPTQDIFAAAVKQGVQAWERLTAPDNAQGLPPLKEVEPAWFNQEPALREVASADGLRVAGTREGSLYVRDRNSDQVRIVATPSGGARWTIEDALWSPGKRYLAAKSINDSAVPRITLTGPQFTGGKAQVPYSRIGQPLPIVRVWIIDVATGKAVAVSQDRNRPYINIVGWSSDEKVLRVLTADRLQRVLELRAANAATGSTRLLHTERQPVSVTSLALLHGFSQRLRDMNLVRFLPDGNFIWMSDRSGFQHLYLHDAAGRMVRSLTDGKMSGFIDRLIDVDAPNRRLFARATGFDSSDPYRHKLVRVDLDRDRIVDLIEADFLPTVRLLPSRNAIRITKAEFPTTVDIVEIDTDGGGLKTLFQSDFHTVSDAGYITPENTYVPAADGVTPLRATVIFPIGFDPSKSYPVIHYIYSGQHTISTPLSPRNGLPWRLVQMGGKDFVFVIIDGRGTPGRGRAFQNYDYRRFGQVQAADQVTGLRALAATRPYMDLKRAGVIGGSWGGYFGLRTALEAPDLYKAGVLFAGAFEMSTMRVSAEPFMGCSRMECPQAYEKASNLAIIDRLKTPLLLLHGTADNDVPIAETLNLVAALKRHGKPYEFTPVDGGNHVLLNWPGFTPRAKAFFTRHLGGPEMRAESAE